MLPSSLLITPLEFINPLECFKEFDDYLRAPSDNAFSTGVESMKRATQKYAKYQTKWIRNKFLPIAQGAPDTHTYVLDTSDAEHWGEVERKALSLTKGFLNHQALPPPSEITSLADRLLLSSTLSKPSAALSLHKKIPCTLCSTGPNDPFLVNEAEWKMHIGSRGHQRILKSLRNREQYMEYLRRKEANDQDARVDNAVELQAGMA